MEYKSTKVSVSGLPERPDSKNAEQIPFGQWFLSRGPSNRIECPLSVWIRMTNGKYYNISEGFYLEIEEVHVYWRDYTELVDVLIHVSRS